MQHPTDLQYQPLEEFGLAWLLVVSGWGEPPLDVDHQLQETIAQAGTDCISKTIWLELHRPELPRTSCICQKSGST